MRCWSDNLLFTVLLVEIIINKMTSSFKLREIFKNDSDFAWRLLEAECEIHTKPDISISDITTLSELYMRAVQRLNSAQDQRELYFSQKMQELMAKPFVIRCFNHETDGKKNNMEFKRKEIEKILFHETEKANPQRLQHMMCQYGQKQKKIKIKIEKIMEEHEKNLQQRLKKRASLKPDRLSYIEQLQINSEQKDKSKKVWRSKVDFNPENSRTTIGSQSIQINSP